MMAALLTTHVQQLSDNAQPQFEDNDDQSDSEGGSNDERSDDGASDGGEDDRDGEGGSNGEEAEDGEEDKEADEGNANAGWAEAMAKILGKKTPESKSSILIKNKELDKMKVKERKEQLERKKQVDKKRAWEMMCREKPDVVKDRETERALQRIATRGVVQLFNAVRKHQKTVNNKVKEFGGSERKKAKFLSSVSKKDFIDVLRRTEEGSRVTGRTEKDAAAAAAEEKPAWSVLTDDFMMGATMKDWDKDSDKEEANTHSGGEVESDSD
ncbi:RRP15-like protein isoform X1 [Etheostoma spectabile]|uniref:RRP15-like protein isoform X1 n=1 Tax=Etheostoma spectabile TaxID=54343 RepID=UPI0013AE8E5F|nr:RRP15-like protein isoform X1 [Etheostoma spectabile]